MFKQYLLTATSCFIFCIVSFSQLKTNREELQKTARDHKDNQSKNLQRAHALAKEKGWALSFKTDNENTAHLVGIDAFGLPLYLATENNTIAAATTGTNKLWAGGSSGLNLSGSSANLKDKVAIWDGGNVLGEHVELTGRILQKDVGGISGHATHVAGTMIGSGINPLAKGMSYGMQRLIAYNFTLDESEMSAEAQNLVLSNHSYGYLAGWNYNNSQSRWEFWGRPNETEDFRFGYYDQSAQMYDSIAYNAPYYLIVKSAGNNRSVNGPPVGEIYYRRDSANQWVSAGPRPSDISSNDGYDIISTTGNAKNILTIGAVRGLEYGYNVTNDVSMSSFSSWGPTDDGRIKPDLVANGVNVLSSGSGTNSSYTSLSGTSMAAPNVSGSLLLLQEYYSKLNNGSFMRAATLKGLAIHTADEAGLSPGPDYQFGWGLLNVANGADVIKSNNSGTHRILENVLNNGATYSMTVVASGKGPLVATLSWTDPKGSIETANVLNNRTKKLVHDLDIKITQGSRSFSPWILDPANPSSSATTGVNSRDNVERINIDDPIPGMSYTIEISHKETLSRGSQAYSLILSGVGGQAYCTSSASTTTGTRIDSVGFSTINRANASGCTNYTNYTNSVAKVEASQSLPFAVKVSSCDGSNSAKIVKAFIDYNINGSFQDPGELVATSPVINGSGTYTGTIVITPDVVVGNSTIMRVVVQETATAADVSSCGSYVAGETQDYRITFISPENDLSILEVVSPLNTTCSSSAQYAVIKIKNNGRVSKSNIPVQLTVKNGSTTVADLTATYTGTIAPMSVGTYTFQTPFVTTPGANYTLTAVVKESTDQNRANDVVNTTYSISPLAAGPSGEGVICNSNALLRVANPGNSSYFWYNSSTATTPIGTGSSFSTSSVPVNNTFYVAKGAAGTVGLPSKNSFPNGGGYLTSNAANFFKYNSTVPVVLESARLYIRYGGNIEFIVADITNQTATSYSYRTISSTTIDVYATSPNPAPGAQPLDPADEGAIFNLNLLLPEGDHATIIRPIGETNIFR
ncbi:MAG TPA: S8 family serine peptidase, partial [Flavisolibacter sp.]|nr:S8 family serine peptidase [Flavisolibacter sp.]